MHRFLFSAIVFSICLTSCGTSRKAGSPILGDYSQNAMDWAGAFAGRLPVGPEMEADVKITFYNNGSYAWQQELPGQKVTVRLGRFSWSNDGSRIVLKDSESKMEDRQFRVSENQLWLADKKGETVLNAQNEAYDIVRIDNPLVEVHWKLIELQGAPVSNKTGKEAFIIFRAQGKRVHGNFGCNNFHGSYTLEYGNRISFSQMATTMMMCPDMELEQAFSEALRMADNYYVIGDQLVLNRARMAPLARFEAVYP